MRKDGKRGEESGREIKEGDLDRSYWSTCHLMHIVPIFLINVSSLTAYQSDMYAPSNEFQCVKLGFHIVVSDGDASKSLDRRYCWGAYDDMGTFFW